MAIAKVVPGGGKRQVNTASDLLARLRAITATAVSATTSDTAVELDLVNDGAVKALIHFQAYTSYSAGSAEWAVAVEVAATSGGSYSSLGSITLDAGPGTREIVFSGKAVEDILSTAAYARVTATKTGSPGNLTYSCDIVPVMVR